jgi:acetyl-CoA carboxylase carboxyltransferase component
MYKEHGGCPSGGVVVKIGYKRKTCVVVANDAVKAGAWFPITAKKKLSTEIAMENRTNHLFSR